MFYNNSGKIRENLSNTMSQSYQLLPKPGILFAGFG